VLGGDAPVSYRVELVYVDRLALRASFYHPLARVVVNVFLLVPVVEDALDAVFLIPDDVSPRAVHVARPAGLVAVVVVAVCPLPYVDGSMGFLVVVGVVPVVGGFLLGDERPGGLHHLLFLVFVDDVVDGVVAHGQAVDVLLAGGELVDPLGVGEAVQVVVAEALVGGAAVFVVTQWGQACAFVFLRIIIYLKKIWDESIYCYY
jgi:hypothetical protein